MRVPESFRSSRHVILSDAELTIFLVVYTAVLFACAGALFTAFRVLL
jgi:hypothetical protein